MNAGTKRPEILCWYVGTGRTDIEPEMEGNHEVHYV